MLISTTPKCCFSGAVHSFFSCLSISIYLSPIYHLYLYLLINISIYIYIISISVFYIYLSIYIHIYIIYIYLYYLYLMLLQIFFCNRVSQYICCCLFRTMVTNMSPFIFWTWRQTLYQQRYLSNTWRMFYMHLQQSSYFTQAALENTVDVF